MGWWLGGGSCPGRPRGRARPRCSHRPVRGFEERRSVLVRERAVALDGEIRQSTEAIRHHQAQHGDWQQAQEKRIQGLQIGDRGA